MSKTVIVSQHSPHPNRMKPYLIGYVVSLVLTLTAYLTVTHHLFSKAGIITVISLLAATQFIVQLIYFLHLGTEAKPRWKLFVFLLMVLMVLIIVVGSIWIMNNLNYNMTSPASIKTYMHENEGL